MLAAGSGVCEGRGVVLLQGKRVGGDETAANGACVVCVCAQICVYVSFIFIFVCNVRSRTRFKMYIFFRELLCAVACFVN